MCVFVYRGPCNKLTALPFEFQILYNCQHTLVRIYELHVHVAWMCPYFTLHTYITMTIHNDLAKFTPFVALCLSSLPIPRNKIAQFTTLIEVHSLQHGSLQKLIKKPDVQYRECTGVAWPSMKSDEEESCQKILEA